jgi:MFS family permease
VRAKRDPAVSFDALAGEPDHLSHSSFEIVVADLGGGDSTEDLESVVGVGVGVAAGPVTGGLLLEHFSWSSVFWALAPLALLAAVLTYFLVPESRDPGVPALDIRGLTTSIALLGVLVYTIIEAPARAGAAPRRFSVSWPLQPWRWRS